MRRIFLQIICCFIAMPAFCQMKLDSVEIRRDSLINEICQLARNIYNIQLLPHNAQIIKNNVGRYKIYPTTNVYTSLKLDTATGQVWALQIGLGDKEPLEYEITDAVDSSGIIVGTYELYSTNNSRNYILLNTMSGIAYQVQWSTKDEECGRWTIY